VSPDQVIGPKPLLEPRPKILDVYDVSMSPYLDMRSLSDHRNDIRRRSEYERSGIDAER